MISFLVFLVAFLIACVGTYIRYTDLPSKAARQAEDVRLNSFVLIKFLLRNIFSQHISQLLFGLFISAMIMMPSRVSIDLHRHSQIQVRLNSTIE